MLLSATYTGHVLKFISNIPRSNPYDNHNHDLLTKCKSCYCHAISASHVNGSKYVSVKSNIERRILLPIFTDVSKTGLVLVGAT